MKYLIVILLFINNLIWAQDIAVKRDDDNYRRLAILDLHDNTTKTLYTSTYELISDITVSSDEKFIAFLEKHTKKVHGMNYIISQLSILNSSGEELYKIDSAVEYSWHPEGNKLVYLLGVTPQESKPLVEDMKILDLELDQTECVGLGYYVPLHLHWVSNRYEDAIYFRSRDIKTHWGLVKYNLKTKDFQHSKAITSNFSPDGEFYAVSTYEASEYGNCPDEIRNDPDKTCFSINSSKTHEKLDQFSFKKHGEPYGWVYGKGHLFLFKKYENPVLETKQYGKVTSSKTVGYHNPVNNVYNVETGVIVQTFKALVYHNCFMLEKWAGGEKIILGEPAGKMNQARTSNQLIKMTIPKNYD